MARKKLIRLSNCPYHITARAQAKVWFPIQDEELWGIFENELFAVSTVFGARVHAFVQMSNHFHLIVSTPDENIDQIMRYFMTETSRRIAWAARTSSHIYGMRYRWSAILDPVYAVTAIKYVYRNPIAAGICTSSLRYPWSTLSGLVGLTPMRFPLYPMGFHERLLPNDPAALVKWVDHPYHAEAVPRAIGKGLRYREFKILKSFSRYGSTAIDFGQEIPREIKE
jgi:REP element-mobilizing transposase RayT